MPLILYEEKILWISVQDLPPSEWRQMTEQKIFNTCNTWEKGCWEIGIHRILVGVQIGIVVLDSSLAGFIKVKMTDGFHELISIFLVFIGIIQVAYFKISQHKQCDRNV